MPFGISSAPTVFQKMMEECNILVTGSNDAQHLETLHKVLQRLEEHEVRIKRSKCKFLSGSVRHRLDAEGIHEKLEAVENVRVPWNVQELCSFLGLLNYYRKFLLKILHPLNELLQARHKWKWSAECADAFQKAKDLLTSLLTVTPIYPSRRLLTPHHTGLVL